MDGEKKRALFEFARLLTSSAELVQQLKAEFLAASAHMRVPLAIFQRAAVACLEKALLSKVLNGSVLSPGRQLEDVAAEFFHRIDADADQVVSWDDVVEGLTFLATFTSQKLHTYRDTPWLARWKEEEVSAVTWVPQLRRYVASGESKSVLLVSAQGQVVRRVAEHTSHIVSVAYIASGAVRRLVTSSTDCTLRLWDDERWTNLETVQKAGPYLTMMYCPTTATLYCGNAEGEIAMYSLEHSKPSLVGYVRSPDGTKAHHDWVTDLLAVQDLNLLVSCSLDSRLKIWDLKSGAFKSVKEGHDKGILRVAYSNFSRLLLSCGYSRDVWVWNPFTRNVLHKLCGHDKVVINIHCVDNSREAISCDESGKIVVWDILKNTIAQTFGGAEAKTPIGTVTATAFNPEHTTICAIGSNISLWTCRDSIDTQTLSLPRPVSCMLYHKAYRMLLTACGDRISLWQSETGELQSVYDSVQDCLIVTMILVNHDEDLAVANVEGLVSFLHLSSGQTFRTVQLAVEPVRLLVRMRGPEATTESQGSQPLL
eukprot:RCo020978